MFADLEGDIFLPWFIFLDLGYHFLDDNWMDGCLNFLWQFVGFDASPHPTSTPVGDIA